MTALDTVDGAPQIRLSVGVARFPEDAATGADLLEAADAALRSAKATGGNVISQAGAPA